MSVTLYQGDCHEYLAQLDENTAIVSDPPYGCKNDCNYTRFRGGISQSRNYHKGIIGDNTPFDPTPWIVFPKVVLFGYQHFADKLPVGTLLIWKKKRDNQLGKFLSDAEVAWMKGGKGCYLFGHVWNGFDRESERGEKTLHPTQKPIEVMKWVIGKLKLLKGTTICDPYMGSGATGCAAVALGFDFVGIELDPNYFAIAQKRISVQK